MDEGVFEVVATHGHTHLGGNNFNERILDHFIKRFERKHKIDHDIRNNQKAIEKLRAEIEKAAEIEETAEVEKIEEIEKTAEIESKSVFSSRG